MVPRKVDRKADVEWHAQKSQKTRENAITHPKFRIFFRENVLLCCLHYSHSTSGTQPGILLPWVVFKYKIVQVYSTMLQTLT